MEFLIHIGTQEILTSEEWDNRYGDNVLESLLMGWTDYTPNIGNVIVGGTELEFAALVDYMNDDLREELHSSLVPCTDQEFINKYLERAKEEDTGFIEVLESEFKVTL